MANSVIFKNYLNVRIEKPAVAAITPGFLVEEVAAGVQAHSDLGLGAFPAMFALEDELQGRGIDDDYAANDPVQVLIPQKGDEINALLAIGETTVVGDQLSSDGNGALKVTGAGEVVVAVALEAVPVGAALQRVKIRIV